MSDEMEFLDRGAILNADDALYEIVDVPEWGGKVRIRALSAKERDAWEASLTKETRDPQNPRKMKYVTDSTNIRAKLVARCVVDKDGKRIFSDEDVMHLGNKNAGPVDKLFTIAQRLSGIMQEDIDKLEGNSERAPSESSSAS